MIKKLKIVLVSLSLLCFIPMNTYAATLNVVGGELMGASDVLVGGLLYNVEFKDGTCAALFGGCDSPDDFIFNTYGSSALASQALLDQVFINGTLGAFDSNPELTNGIEDTTVANIWNPYDLGLWVTAAANFPYNPNDIVYARTIPPLHDSADRADMVFAVWHRVPEPELFVLLACGLAGLAVFARRQRKREERLTF